MPDKKPGAGEHPFQLFLINCLVDEDLAADPAVVEIDHSLAIPIAARDRHDRLPPCARLYIPARTDRARVSTPTHSAPARRNTRAHSSAVAPVVSTSSIMTIRLPFTLRPRRNAKAPRTFLVRAAGPSRPCIGVRRRRISQSGATGGPPGAWMACASNPAWLKRRANSRVQCSGTGTIRS